MRPKPSSRVGQGADPALWSRPASNNAQELPPDQQGRSDRPFTRDPAIGNVRSGSVKSGPKTAGRDSSLRRREKHGAGQTTRNALVAILDEQHLNDMSGLICTKT
jgi:hypothetical protein